MVLGSSNIDLSAIMQIIEKYPADARHTLAILQDIQRKWGYIPKESMEIVSDYLKVPVSKLYSIATFYKALSLKPKGRNVIKVCDGTACHIKSSPVLVGEIKRLLNIEPGETTEDGVFSLETVNCLGSCAIAPVMVVNETYYGKVTPSRLKEILDGYGGGKNE